ncbi:MAG TPA: hypothetical protein DCR06_03110, partial [Planctomycetaceae bacterium]|nr:hypothetical protein [Planctomycetaceae bacterium]
QPGEGSQAQSSQSEERGTNSRSATDGSGGMGKSAQSEGLGTDGNATEQSGSEGRGSRTDDGAGGASGSSEGSGSAGSGGMSGGPQGTGKAQGDTPSDGMDAESQNLSAVRQATDLALDHLRDSIRSTDDEMLKELGWTREQAEAFLQRWDNMQKASVNGNQGQKQAFEQTLRSLGLRPDRVRSSRQIEEDSKGVQIESRRTQPPYEYRERFKAFMKGASSRQVDVNEQ